MDPIVVPLFTRLLTPNDLKGSLNFPSRVLSAFPFPEGSHFMVFEAFDVHNHARQFRLSTRRFDRYRKPVLSRAHWRRYVEQKNLRVNDRVTFSMELNQAYGVRYRVKAERILTIFGKDIWVDVE
ncbi:hypothetical protein P3X46_021412 [Hevea brasiliensis]|uniref:TF-B3 domain-containing protein n=1 Tax=Hevea brasiliensis TaxID=3981 RepID=A0ABQ9LJA5_HEVBR|nr:hypothetical protein P3X46_021412 [Hevea brasiliensis]